MEKSVQITMIIVGAVVILTLLGFAMISQVLPSNTIRVDGESNVEVMPDLVGVYFNIQTFAGSATEAKDKNSEIADEVITALLRERFDREEIVTQSFSVNPNYVWRNGQNKIEGYVAQHFLKLEMSTENIEKIGKAIDAGVNSGATISYINFELSREKQNQYKAQALKEATEDAKIKAEAMAEGLGKKLGSIVSTSDSSFYYSPWMLYGEVRSEGLSVAKEAVTDIQPGEQDINARVSVVYKIR